LVLLVLFLLLLLLLLLVLVLHCCFCCVALIHRYHMPVGDVRLPSQCGKRGDNRLCKHFDFCKCFE
jgi:hypothetical protein